MCFSGFMTCAVCGGVVDDLTINWCANGPCANAIRATRSSGNIGQPGDSGEPVYQRLSGSNARIVGIVVGGPCCGPQPSGYFNAVSVVENGVGPTVSTACCNNTSW